MIIHIRNRVVNIQVLWKDRGEQLWGDQVNAKCEPALPGEGLWGGVQAKEACLQKLQNVQGFRIAGDQASSLMHQPWEKNEGVKKGLVKKAAQL